MDLGFPSEVTFEITAKKQRRKEHGIYYTPRFVTDYIVKETVGRFLQEHSYNEALNIKILDPACGSGSFLIRAYDELLNYHADKRSKAVSELDQWERLPILTGNIFGVDLDMQAVEIARLNLLLRSLAKREVLPSLASNIRQGNSLISGTEEELRPYFGDAWREKKPFDWEQEFGSIMAGGGFDVIIGNPPYVRIQTLPRDEVAYFSDQYQAAVGNYDIYCLFIERALNLLKPSGVAGFILPTKFFQAEYGKGLRKILTDADALYHIVDFSHERVFGEVSTYTCLLFLSRKPSDTFKYAKITKLSPTAEAQLALISKHNQYEDSSLQVGYLTSPKDGGTPWIFALGSESKLLDKTKDKHPTLASVSKRIFQGLITSADKVYVLDPLDKPSEGKIKVRSRITGQAYKLEAEVLRPFLTGRDITPYYSSPPAHYLLFPYQISSGIATLISEHHFRALYPAAWEYLNLNKGILEAREGGKMKGERWYAFGRTQNLALHDCHKLAIPSTVKRLSACYDEAGSFYLDNVRINGIILNDDSEANYRYVTGLLNSKLLHWCFIHGAVRFSSGYFAANRQFIAQLPIRRIDFDNPLEKKLHDDLVALVDRRLELTKRIAPIRTTPCNERDELLREIEHTNREIDNLVYDLYGLSEAERKVVEEGQQKS
jgi:methylase of polypeptide subunit release factors